MDKTWYWNKGLHDAEIMQIVKKEFDYDYTKSNPIRNCLQLFVNSKNALFDTTIECINLYNYKILNGDININGFWWMNDVLSEESGKFNLRIILHKKNEKKVLEVIFERAEIIHK